MNERNIIETQPERTDLPLIVIPVIVESMIEPFAANFPLLHDIARIRMHCDFTLDTDTILERTKDAEAVIVIGFHITDDILDAMTVRGHVSCFAFGGTGVASYINLEKTKERGIRVCNVLHYGDHAVAEHAMALLMELTRHAGALDMQVKQGDWDGADGFELFGKKLGIIGLGGIGQTVARIANAYGMKVSAWNSHVPEQVLTDCNVTPVDDMNELIAGSDVVSIHMPLLDSTRGIITAENLEALRPGTLFVNTARAEILEPGALLKRLERGDIPAALDVFEHEPLGADDPLCRILGIVLTPHTAWRTDGAYVGITEQVVQSVAAFFRGEDFNVVV